jgi:hypothetical protein
MYRDLVQMSQLKIQDIVFNLQVNNSAPAPHVLTPTTATPPPLLLKKIKIHPSRIGIY